ncbi:hypothetical protein [Pseudomonas japonica]|uniref:Uncharacterized protein n=1 Tax=Pseudomonas japonica TaxID=256466 RepID=A0A239JLV6_9PSED|nr:hypothetical protein [Pseudomonas japonica]SNT07006.1 hypothetical protein SAMN05444352_1232 [Pseudomonas japonica]
MKKLVPDPPILCVGPGLSHEDAIRRAEDHLKKAIALTSYLPAHTSVKHQRMLSDALLDMRICKALLTVALSRSTVSVPV